jgi:hypothetical protein
MNTILMRLVKYHRSGGLFYQLARIYLSVPFSKANLFYTTDFALIWPID